MNDSPRGASPLTEFDACSIVCLLEAVLAEPNDIKCQRQLLMGGLCDMIQASAWVWCMSDFDPEKPSSFIGLIDGNYDQNRFARYLGAMKHPRVPGGGRSSAIESQKKRQYLSQAAERREPHFLLDDSKAAPYWKRADVGALITSQRPMEGGGISGIGVYRAAEQPPFDDRETRIAHMILSEVPWLKFHELPDQVAQLYPRHRTVLNLLCEGWGRKKIADHLGLSIHTIHGYSKTIYRHFDVHSQAELIARFNKRGGADR